jgi:hypothetical protein
MQIIFRKTMWLLLLFLNFVVAGIVYAQNEDNKRVSLDLDNCTISGALNQLKMATGVDIVLNGKTGDRLINKTLKDYSIDEAIAEILRGEEVIIERYYNRKGLSSMSIWIIKEGEKKYEDPGKTKPTGAETVLRRQESSSLKQGSLNKYEMDTPPPPPEKIKGLGTPPTPPGMPSMVR